MASLQGAQRERNRNVRRMFSGIAGAYDFLNHFLSGGMDILWRRKAVRMLPDRPRPRALDLCGGTGDFARALLKCGGAESVVLADFALPMLSIAQCKLAQLPATIQAVDAHDLPYEDESFDMAQAAFGLRNVTDLERGVRELYRVLKPGGELLVLEFMGGQRGAKYYLFLAYFKYVMPWIGRVVSRDRGAYHYLPESVSSFCSKVGFAQLLEKCGFVVETQRDVTLGIATITLARKK